jgi:site-specific recombinase XerD
MKTPKPNSSAIPNDDLFEPGKEDWQKSPLLSFDTWLSQQGFSASSCEVYRAQWHHFVRWLTPRKLSLNTLDQGHLEQFLASLEIRQDQRQRYLRLIERVLGHLYRTSSGTANPATATAQNPDHEWTSAAPNEPTGFLDPRDYRTLVSALSEALPPSLSTAGLWREQRDRTIVAVFAGAGLKMAELQNLTVSCIFVDEGWILIKNPASRFAHRTQMQPFAKALMASWLESRSALGTAGALVFPATRAGRTMHKATVLRATTDQIRRAGIAQQHEARVSPQTLRNAYAAMLFESGQATELVAEWMGFDQLLSAQRLKGAWDAWQERHRRVHALDQKLFF